MPWPATDPWQDGAGGGTPTSAARFNTREALLAAYADQQSGQVQTFGKVGTLVVEAGSGKFIFPVAATVVSVRAAVGTAPTGASVLVDVNKNGTTIFTTQANRPAVAAGQTISAAPAVPNVTSMAAGDALTVDIDQIGSGTPGSDLTVMIFFRLV